MALKKENGSMKMSRFCIREIRKMRNQRMSPSLPKQERIRWPLDPSKGLKRNRTKMVIPRRVTCS